ncbi:MAG: glutamate--tRNA ligase [Methanomicrobiales archaeon]|nr:glutamate--tRNA ligase [Methanomicrobiales archaeon]
MNVPSCFPWGSSSSHGGTDTTTDLHDILCGYALQNAVKYGDLPNRGTVIAKFLGVHPDLRPQAREIAALVGPILYEVAALSPEARKALLEKRYPVLSAELHAVKEHTRKLPALPGAEHGVVMRFAPNPSGPLHIGHARASVLNDAYVRRYSGKYILRIEDTDPKRVDPEAYRTVQEDIAWLGLRIDETVYQSDRLEIYYRLGEDLIRMGGAYVCTCEAERFRTLKLAKKACPCRELSVEENLTRWQSMLEGGYTEGEVSIRVKTDLEAPDPAIRDFPAFRIVTSPPHPRVEATVFPLMNFSVAVDDHLLGVTHVIRGKDHIANTERQRYIFEYFGWIPPVYRHYGRMSIEHVVLSTSQMRAGIREGRYAGWDDIRLGTLRAIARRGIEPEAVYKAMLDIGIGETDISFSWENLYARNREIVDRKASRYFFVPDPVRLEVEGAVPRVSHPLLQPSDPTRGTRILHFQRAVLLPAAELATTEIIRLKDLFNISVSSKGQALYTGDSLAEARERKAPIIQWLPEEEHLPCTLHTPEGDLKGVCEPRIATEVGNVVQFERIGFARIDRVTDEGIEAYFAHR